MEPKFNEKRFNARLTAVQALYQMDMNQTPVNTVIEEFLGFRVSEETIDGQFFEELLNGVVQFQSDIDQKISSQLSEKWSLKRLDRTLRAILRAGFFEISQRPDIPALVVIDQYVSIASDFFEDRESGFVNGALEAFAKSVRAAEFGLTGSSV